MKNKFLLLSITLLTVSTLFGQANIDDARSFAVGSTITIKGVSANGSELGSIRYIQDETGGLPVYGYNETQGVNRGDSVVVTGILKEFNGLLEMDPITSLTNEGVATQIAPWNINISDLSNTYEGRLVQIDNVTFPDAGQTFSNSANYVITDGTNSTEIRINSGTGMGGQTIPSGPQSVIGLVSEFNGSFQLLPRDMNDIIAYVPPAKKLEVWVDGVSVLNGATIQIGQTTSTVIELKNLGTNSMTVSNVTFNGIANADYSTTMATGAIASNGNVTGNITFSATANGSRKADLTITSDDPENPTFILHLYGIGIDGLASEPSNGATNLTFSNVEAYMMNGNCDAAAAEAYLVVWKEASAPAGTPTDGKSYLRGDTVGTDGAKVAYFGTNTSFKPRGIRANIDYYFVVYALNGYGNYVNYLQSAPLNGMQTSGGSEIGNYYQGISSSDPNLLNDLTTLINPHTHSSYYMYKILMMDPFEVKDTTGGQSYVTCHYSGEKVVFSGSFDWMATGYSREHTYAHSWMPTYPNDVNPELDNYADYFNLYPVNQNDANVARSNLPLGVVTNVTYTFGDCKRGENANGELVFEPRDEQKGNAARSLFYMAVAYNGMTGNNDNWGLPSNQDVTLLKEWNLQDLPDNYEIARNELIYSIQGNRNPFTDSIQFACRIDFHNMTYLTEGCESLGLSKEYIANNLSIFPNPSNEVVFVQLNGIDISAIRIMDITGKEIGTYHQSVGKHYVKMDVSQFELGTYFLQIKTPKGAISRKIIVQ